MAHQRSASGVRIAMFWSVLLAGLLPLVGWASPRVASNPVQFALLGQIGGVAHAAAWAGDILYLGIGPRLVA